MGDYNPLQLSMFLGPDKYTAPQLVIRGETVQQITDHVNNLLEVDEIEGVSMLDTLLDGVLTINAAVTVKFGVAAKPAPSPDGGFTPGGFGAPSAPQAPPAPNCDVHNLPMLWVADGVVKSGANAGKHYTAHKCSAPYSPGSPKCNMKNFAWK